jgi:HPt (histidine-containing phosphotransfer) domain-containing protein
MAMLEELQSLGTPQYVVSLIEQFMQDTRSRLDLLADAIERADHASVRSLAHALRGSAAGIGAQRLAALATALETHAQQQLPADAQKRLLSLREEYELLAVELLRIANGPAASRAS